MAGNNQNVIDRIKRNRAREQIKRDHKLGFKKPVKPCPVCCYNVCRCVERSLRDRNVP